jgi:DNA-directed RNA polymerase specialized sigma24 family protein
VLQELDGLRALARSLVHGDADADDLLQEPP